MNLTHRQLRILAAALTLLLWLGPSLAAEAQEPLTLRVNNAEARPGGLLALVLRTYASRQLGQGCVGLHAPAGLLDGAEGGIEELFSNPLRPTVFSDANDAVSRLEVVTTGDGPTMLLCFRSPTKTVNQSDGPMSVIYFRLPPTVVPGTEVDLLVDPAETFLIDHLGREVPVAATAGRIRILQPADLLSVAAEAEDTVPGEPAILSLQTAEALRLSGGQAAFRFKPRFFEGAPVVDIDRRYGAATWIVDDSTPGLVIVSFESANSSLNKVPGNIITLTMATRANIPSGTTTPIRLDRNLTFLTDWRGANRRLDIEQGLLVFE